ncbi:MAG: menaquinone biosynthetic enzyme MqnA/MqnD family protein [Thermoanaerobaculia bacterium]
MAKLRVGIVDYLNSRPLAWDFLSGALADRYQVLYEPPARVADLLASGDIDIGLIPSIEYQRIPDLAVIPGACVASDSAVRSVLLVSNVPFGDIRTLALDENSRTSAILVRIVLKELYGAEPTASPARPDLDVMLADSDAALIIGDPALRIPMEEGRVLDLAVAWKKLTGLPFVFAFWAVRSGAVRSGLEADFSASIERGRRNLSVLAHEAGRELGLSEASLLDYLERNLRFDLGEPEVAGLEEFFRRSAALLKERDPVPLRFVEAADGSGGGGRMSRTGEAIQAYSR